MSNSDNPYESREQTQVKHFILKSYLQALAFKLLKYNDCITYVDGFSGPWQSTTEDFSDTSFKIAIDVLKDVQRHYREQGRTISVRCFLVEKNQAAHQKLEQVIIPFNSPSEQFVIEIRCGKFEDAAAEILEFIDDSFALVFIDPTGWTGYPYSKIKPLLRHQPGEVLINFMYDSINRFIDHADPAIEASLDPILGGPGWKKRLDPSLSRGRAVEKLFRNVLQEVGQFKFVTSTCINRATIDRPHFFLAYGTRHEKGLKTFRDIEYDALRKYEGTRTVAKQQKKEASTGQMGLFDPGDLPENITLDADVEVLKEQAKAVMLKALDDHGGSMNFSDLQTLILQSFMLRQTNIKDVCVTLANEGLIERTWKLRSPHAQKPNIKDVIRLTS